jgi:hypothetical protein
VAAAEQERTRFVTPPFTNYLRHDLGEPGRPDLLPPWSP